MMEYKKILMIFLLSFMGFSLSLVVAEETNLSNVYTYNDIDFGSDRDSDFKHGVRDGCKTAKGDYVKDYSLFKDSKSYKIGWENGRIKCEDQ